jgi:hypothetical protein
MLNNDEAVVLYSGGSDSTLSVALIQEQYRKVHLVTYKRFGLWSIENTGRYVETLKERFGRDKFQHQIINIDRVFKYLSYESYCSNLRKHGFFLLSTCGFCKLAMHVRTVVYCLENNVGHVCDGANKGMDIYPAQMEPVLEMIKGMYEAFGIHYYTPVFDYEPPQEQGFVAEENRGLIQMDELPIQSGEGNGPNTTEAKLYEMGITPQPRIKGTAFDKARQGRCFQLILFRVFANKYFLASHSMEEYVERTVELFGEKIDMSIRLIRDYIEKGTNEKRIK